MAHIIWIGLAILWASALSYAAGRGLLRRERAAAHPRIEKTRPLPRYWHVIAFDSLDLGQNVRILQDESSLTMFHGKPSD